MLAKSSKCFSSRPSSQVVLDSKPCLGPKPSYVGISLVEEMENLQINDLEEMFIKSLQKKRICFVILGQNALAQSILVNELLGRYLLPFEISHKLSQENWRFVRIKVPNTVVCLLAVYKTAPVFGSMAKSAATRIN